MDKQELINRIKEVKEKSGKRKFKQSIELALNFKEINMNNAEYKLNLSVNLPKGRGKGVKIGVFADGDMNIRAKKLTDQVLNKAEVASYSKDRRKMRKFANSCYTFIAQPDLMPVIGKSWGIVLGPRGKMPQPVPDNADLNGVFTRLQNTVRIRSKKNPTIQVPIGVEDMSEEDLSENVLAVLSAVERQIPKEKIYSAYVKTSMGEAVKIM